MMMMMKMMVRRNRGDDVMPYTEKNGGPYDGQLRFEEINDSGDRMRTREWWLGGVDSYPSKALLEISRLVE